MSAQSIEVPIVATVVGGHLKVADGFQGSVESIIRLRPDYPLDTLQGIEEFSHLQVTWYFSEGSPSDVALHARQPSQQPGVAGDRNVPTPQPPAPRPAGRRHTPPLDRPAAAARLLRESALRRPPHPAICVSWWSAYAFARFEGKRLPTSLEWEAAARGTDGRLFPWGDTPDSTRVNCADTWVGLPVVTYQAWYRDFAGDADSAAQFAAGVRPGRR